MKKTLSVLLIIILMSGLGILAAMAASGGADDPLVSLSYLKTTLSDKLLALSAEKDKEALDGMYKKANAKLDGMTVPKAGVKYAPKFTAVDFDDGGTMTLDEFGCFILIGGTGRLYITSGEVINISTGESCASGEILKLNNKYFAAEQSSAYIRMYTDDAWGMVDGYYNYEVSGVMPLRESFLDVGEEHWAASYIFALAEKGIVNGVGGHKFAPSATVTRGTFVTIIGRMCGVDAKAYTATGFDDTDIAKWYGPYVAWASGAGLVLGDGGKFYPDNAMTREQMAVIISRFADYMKIQYQKNENAAAYADGDRISPWAAEAVVKARDLGIMTGKENNMFDPKGTATRAEICAVARRLMELAGINK